jgi:multisubunit Na+/H+ antiporter MnhB subunit
MIEEEKFLNKVVAGIILLLIIFASASAIYYLKFVGISVDWNFTRAPAFLWTYRLIDVLVQALIVFATIAAVYALLREEKVGFVEEVEE